MRIRIAHETRYSYDRAARSVLQILRMTPRGYEGQHVLSWRVEPSVEGKLKRFEDPFGNICHQFAAEQEVTEYSLIVSGEVETHETAGLVQGAPERLPDPVYLRQTELTFPDEAIRDFAVEHAGSVERDPLGAMHRLLEAVNATVAFDTSPTDAGTSAAESFAMRRGVCQDLTHIFIAAARHLGIPARYVSGYLHRSDGVIEQEAAHAWCEVKLPNLGWVGFDAANGISTTEAHVRTAIGLDYLGAAPIRGSRRGGGAETLEVRLTVDMARRHVQN